MRFSVCFPVVITVWLETGPISFGHNWTDLLQ